MTDEKVVPFQRVIAYDESDLNIFGIYSIFDKQNKTFGPPLIAQSEADIMRQTSHIVNYVSGLINKFPQDYTLYLLGVFDQQKGIIQKFDVPELVINLSALKSEDTIKYDELLKEVKSQNAQLTLSIKQCDEIVVKYDTKLRELSVLEDKIKDKYANKDTVDLMPIPVKKEIKKRTILDRLFS